MKENKKKFGYIKLHLVLIVLLILFSILLISRNIEFISKAVSQMLSVSISIASAPIVNITSPLNITYNDHDINLGYSIINFTRISSCYFNLNNGYNNTIPNCINISFYAFYGSNTLNLYVNDSLGNLNKTSVTFFQNESYQFYYSNYSGSSTNLSHYTEQQLQNLSNFTLDNSNWGKMFFLENVNISGDVNFDLHTNISFNRIEINISALNFLNKSATLYIYNLTLSNPRIAKDGVVCPSTICKINSYSNGILSFNVTGFSVFQTEEIPSSDSGSSSGSSSSGGGGGGGSGYVVKGLDAFILVDDTIRVKGKIGGSTSVLSKIINNGNSDLSVSISVLGLGSIIRIKEQTVNVKAKSDANFELIFDIPEDFESGVYIGKLVAKSGLTEKTISVVVEAESFESLFDIIIELDEEYKTVGIGEEFRFGVTVFNIKLQGLIDVTLSYQLIDQEGLIVLDQHETRAVERQLTFLKKLKVPNNAKEGNYILYVGLDYEGVSASSSEYIEVVSNIRKPASYPGEFYIIILLIIFVVLTLGGYLFYHHKKDIEHKEQYHKFNEEDLIRLRLVKIKEEENKGGKS